MIDAIDMDVLREILAQTESMRAYYERSEEKVAQNAAMAAAGLPPLHGESQLKWDRDAAAKKQREIVCLKAVIAHLGGDLQAEAA